MATQDKAIVNSLEKYFKKEADLLLKLFDGATDTLWTARSGKIAYWQHIHHAAYWLDFFINPEATQFDHSLFPKEVPYFMDFPANPPTREALRAFCEDKIKKVQAWAAAFDDERLAHLTTAEKTGELEAKLCGMFISLEGHSMYHIGACDVLRMQNGIESVY